MRIVEQAFRVTERTSLVKADHPTETLFQVFVKGRLQDKRTYTLSGDTIDFGFDCLVPGDVVQIFYFIP
ncbi:MAG TPA: hypothetical protein PKA10_00380 [Selenomonadales bacterium]|nr:hypothetical protein [Selenomonadales bacterium]